MVWLYLINTHTNLVVENSATNDISWSIDGNGNIRPTDKSKVSGAIEIPSVWDGKPVTGIGSFAFRNCSSLTSVTFAEDSQLTSIGYWAFIGCNSLTSINIPSSVTSIGKNAFDSCTSLTSVNFAEGSKLNNIGYWAFIGCNSLTSINIPSSVTSIGGSAFESCTSLTIVNFDNDSQLTTIGAQAFFNCCSLKTIAIPSGLTQIGPNAFNECIALKSIIIPSSITSIGETAFGNCDKMGTITFNWNEEQLSKLTLGNNLFESISSSQTINFHIPWGTKDQYKVKFTQDILGTNVTANWIDDIQWNITNDGLISPADKGQIQGEITIPDTVNGKTVTGIANNAFSGCDKLISITFAEGSQLTSIGAGAFNGCSSLTNITIPDSVTIIVAYAFQKCTSLTSINIPSGVTSIGTGAFSYCPLTSIEFAGNQTYDWVPTVEGSDTVGGYIIQKGKDLSTNAVAGGLAYGKINIKTASVPNNNISNWAFGGCAGITSVIIPSNVTSIGSHAFDSCISLTSIAIPSSVTSIGVSAFSDCVKLTNVNFTDDSKLNNIGNYAFNNCSSLTNINIPSGVTSIGKNAFRDCSSLKDVTFNWNIDQLVTDKLTLGDNLFRNNTSSQTISFHIPWGTKDQYIATFTPGILGTNITAKWIEDNHPVPSSNSNLALILGLTFGFIILIGIGSYLGYRYYKHHKNSK